MALVLNVFRKGTQLRLLLQIFQGNESSSKDVLSGCHKGENGGEKGGKDS